MLIRLTYQNDGLGYIVEESFPGLAKTAEAAERFRESQEKNDTAWAIANNTDLPMFEFFEHHPARMARFMGAMRVMASGEVS
jgi:6-hydroxytryprostatin B O-methyltransferase